LGHVFVGSGARDGTLYSLDPDTGRVEWQTSLGAAITTSVAVSGTDLYVGTADGTMYRVAGRTGVIQSSLKLGADASLRPRGVPMATGGAVLVLLADREENFKALVSLDAELGRTRWRQTAATRWHTTRLFVRDDTVILGTPTGEVVSYCLKDGMANGSNTIPGMVRSIGGSDGVLYVGTTEGTLYALDAVPLCLAP
jgi:outer membrane protein assembly factor BamB